MSAEQEKHDHGQLQHDAEHERPPKKNPVLLYLVILFAAAFLLLLMSYFAQQRDNQAALDHLEQSSSSAVETLDQILAERDGLTARVAALEEEIAALEENAAQLEGQLEAAQAALQAARLDSQTHLELLRALERLNQIRALYNDRRNNEARELIARYPELEGQLEEISANYLSEESRENYDPLEAYRKIKDWLD